MPPHATALTKLAEMSTFAAFRELQIRPPDCHMTGWWSGVWSRFLFCQRDQQDHNHCGKQIDS